eukprot:TRINITY_DN2575_c0_g1_i1.p1 TRINITY_DN2575_c0_g1~~TRINITY_DN2575_c0_g1_i1.p1  ORF type:complete len:170 (+),score=11.43 TRINITY_DN2575_c0_g1_i1:42-512(+)
MAERTQDEDASFGRARRTVLVPYLGPTEEQQQLSDEHRDLSPYIDIPWISHALEVQLQKARLPENFIVFFALFLGSNGIATLSECQSLSHDSPCFKDVPPLLVGQLFLSTSPEMVELVERHDTGPGSFISRKLGDAWEQLSETSRLLLTAKRPHDD